MHGNVLRDARYGSLRDSFGRLWSIGGRLK
jgi:uncharacterized glyoxalase superfamily protein PhnB